ncbi:MAG: hypothetical protein AAFN74_07630 [Myxococcota bacterium]
MNSELGRYFEGRMLETQKLLRALYDVGTSPGGDVDVWVDGRELVFGRGSRAGRGFMRLIPAEIRVVVGFPRGFDLFDPARRLKGPAMSQKSLTLGQVFEIDPYVRRLVEEAYRIA